MCWIRSDAQEIETPYPELRPCILIPWPASPNREECGGLSGRDRFLRAARIGVRQGLPHVRVGARIVFDRADLDTYVTAQKVGA